MVPWIAARSEADVLVELNGMNAGLRPALPTAGGLPSVAG
jgi:hypothetical protein